MFLQLISANRRNTLFNYAFHKSSLFSIFFYVFSKKLLTTSAFSCIVHYVVEMQRNFIIKVVQEWRNWQTRRLQVPVVAISCGFKSRFLHYFFLLFYQNPFGIVTLQAVSTEGAAMILIRYKVGSTGWTFFLHEENAVFSSSFRVTGSLHDKCSLHFFCIWISSIWQIGLACTDFYLYFCNIFCVDHFL